MKIGEAIQILEDHNEWRRDRNVPNSQPETKPKKLGEAIDVIVNNREKIVCKSCDGYGTSGHDRSDPPNWYMCVECNESGFERIEDLK